MSKRVGFIFPGQGSQSIGMGKDFFEQSEQARVMFDEAKSATGIDFEKLLFEENEDLEKTEFTQPAILLVSLIAHRLLMEQVTINPALVLGHSLGEVTALVSVGGLSLPDAISLVNSRGKYMQEACENIEAGMMAVIGLDDTTVETICRQAREEGKQVWPANYNSEGQLVIAGIKPDLLAIEPILKEHKAKRALLLAMSVASHCPLLTPAQIKLKKLLEEKVVDALSAPIISNVTTKPYQTKAEAVELLAKQLIEPVKYKHSIEAIAQYVDVLIEFGNGSVLKGLNKRIAKDLETYSVSDISSLQKAVEALQ